MSVTSPTGIAEILKLIKAKKPNMAKVYDNNKVYWHSRIDGELQSIYNDELKRNVKLQQVYQRAYENMDREMATFIKKYGEEGVISRSEYYAFDRNLELIDGIKTQLQKVGVQETSFIEKSLINSYKRSYKAIGKDLNIILDKTRKWNNVPPQNLERALKLNIQDKNWSSRIWTNKEKSLQRIQETLEDSISQNLSYDKASKLLQERMNVSYADADRLVATEMNHIITEAELDAFKEQGVRRYEIIAVMDERTTEICKNFDGKVFSIEEKKTGINAPPFHVRCRTTIAPEVNWGDTQIPE